MELIRAVAVRSIFDAETVMEKFRRVTTDPRNFHLKE